MQLAQSKSFHDSNILQTINTVRQYMTMQKCHYKLIFYIGIYYRHEFHGVKMEVHVPKFRINKFKNADVKVAVSKSKVAYTA